jgi:hypothetical protein
MYRASCAAVAAPIALICAAAADICHPSVAAQIESSLLSSLSSGSPSSLRRRLGQRHDQRERCGGT